MPAAGDNIYSSDYRNGVIPGGFAERITSSVATVTTEIGYLRLDNLTLYAGRQYRIWTPPLSMRGTVAGDIPEARIRYSTTSPATTASTFLIATRAWADSAANPDRIPMQVSYSPGANVTTASVLLSIVRMTAGAGSTGVQLEAAASAPIQLLVEDIGEARANAGISL